MVALSHPTGPTHNRPAQGKKTQKIQKSQIILVVFIAVALIMISLLIIVIYNRRRAKRRNEQIDSGREPASHVVGYNR